jgi:hypothetical protein
MKTNRALPKLPVNRLVAALAALILALGIGGLVVATVAQTVTLQQQSNLISTLSVDNDALRDQVLASGKQPVAPPAQERIDAAELIGPAGPPGAIGAEGRGIASFACLSDGSWLVTYTDGAQQTLTGNCNPTNGTDGQTGPDGPTGPTGGDGSNGEPPTSWQWDWLGTTYTCTRDEPFNTDSPTYTCNP